MSPQVGKFASPERGEKPDCRALRCARDGTGADGAPGSAGFRRTAGGLCAPRAPSHPGARTERGPGTRRGRGDGRSSGQATPVTSASPGGRQRVRSLPGGKSAHPADSSGDAPADVRRPLADSRPFPTGSRAPDRGPSPSAPGPVPATGGPPDSLTARHGARRVPPFRGPVRPRAAPKAPYGRTRPRTHPRTTAPLGPLGGGNAPYGAGSRPGRSARGPCAPCRRARCVSETEPRRGAQGVPGARCEVRAPGPDGGPSGDSRDNSGRARNISRAVTQEQSAFEPRSLGIHTAKRDGAG